MKITIPSDELLRAVKRAKPAIGKSSIAILGCVRFEVVGEDKAEVVATNLSETIVVEVEGADGEPGEPVAVPFKALETVARKVRKGSDVTFEVSDKVLEVEAGRSSFKLDLLSAEDYPKLPGVDADPFLMTADTFFGIAGDIVSGESRRSRRGLSSVCSAGASAGSSSD